MENATKALLIAAAVLIVIVIIALGVALLNPGSDMKGQAEAVGESTSVQAFNAQFSPYLGNKKNASTARTLISVVKASNNHNVDKVLVKQGTKAINSSSDLSLDDAKTYQISVSEYYDNEKIKTITISK